MSRGCQSRDDLTKSPVETSKGLLWRMLFRMLRGDDSTLSHVELHAALATAGNVASSQPIPLRSHTRRTAEAQVELQAVQDNQYLGSDRHQRDLRSLQWKPWNEQGFTSLLSYVHLEENKRHADRKVEPRTSKQDLHKAPRSTCSS